VKLSRPITHDGTVIIPKQAREPLNINPGDSIEVEITHKDTTVHDIRKLSSNGRIYIPEKLRKALDIDEGDIVTLDIKKVIKKKEREVR